MDDFLSSLAEQARGNHHRNSVVGHRLNEDAGEAAPMANPASAAPVASQKRSYVPKVMDIDQMVRCAPQTRRAFAQLVQFIQQDPTLDPGLKDELTAMIKQCFDHLRERKLATQKPLTTRMRS